MADGVGFCVRRVCRFRSMVIRMDPDIGEAPPEARFHEGTRSRIERLSRRPQHLVHDRRRSALVDIAPVARTSTRPLPLEPALVVAARARPLERVAGNRRDNRRIGPERRDWCVPRGCSWRPHHAVRDAVRLLLERVVDVADRELGLQRALDRDLRKVECRRPYACDPRQRRGVASIRSVFELSQESRGAPSRWPGRNAPASCRHERATRTREGMAFRLLREGPPLGHGCDGTRKPRVRPMAGAPRERSLGLRPDCAYRPANARAVVA
jgi:hypothetical protein